MQPEMLNEAVEWWLMIVSESEHKIAFATMQEEDLI